MVGHQVASPRHSYRARLEGLAGKTPEEPDEQADWAKYLCVLASGYLEQALKEILLEFASQHDANRLQNYIEATWPESRNMKTANIREILNHFDQGWSTSFDQWIVQGDQYKSEINSLISSRNDIAHGKEANTTNVTLRSTRNRIRIAIELVEFLEGLVLQDAEEVAQAVG
jgi:hypothetical protein